MWAHAVEQNHDLRELYISVIKTALNGGVSLSLNAGTAQSVLREIELSV